MTTIARRRLHALIVVGAFAGVVGCTDDKGTTTGDSGGTTDGATTDGATTGSPAPECACIPVEPDGAPASLPTCGEELCPLVHGYGYDTGGMASDTPEALTCVLTALRDRTPGLVRWSGADNDAGFGNEGYALITGGAAIHRRWGAEDLVYITQDAVYGELPAPGEFDACLAAELPWERARCVFSLVLTGPLVVCDEGWDEVIW